MARSADRLSTREYLRGTGVILGREWGTVFDAPIAYVFATVFLALSCAIFMNSFFLDGVLEMRAYFEVLPYLLMAFAPAITMRIWAEERAQHTFELLMTFPMQPGQIVIGKFLSALAFYSIVLCGTLPIPIMLFWLGSPDLGLLFANYSGAFFLGALFLAFGMFASGLTRDQVVAFVLAALIGAIFVLSAHEKVVVILDGLSPGWQMGTRVYASLSVGPHLAEFARGVISMSSLLYFALMTAFFLWMNALSLTRSRC